MLHSYKAQGGVLHSSLGRGKDKRNEIAAAAQKFKQSSLDAEENDSQLEALLTPVDGQGLTKVFVKLCKRLAETSKDPKKGKARDGKSKAFVWSLTLTVSISRAKYDWTKGASRESTPDGRTMTSLRPHVVWTEDESRSKAKHCLKTSGKTCSARCCVHSKVKAVSCTILREGLTQTLVSDLDLDLLID